MKRRADKQITQDDDGSSDAGDEVDASGEFKHADVKEIARRPMKGLPKRMQTAIPTPDPVPSAPVPPVTISPLNFPDVSTTSGFRGFGSSTTSSGDRIHEAPATVSSGFGTPAVGSTSDRQPAMKEVVPPTAPASVISSTMFLGEPQAGLRIFHSDEQREVFQSASLEIQHKLCLWGLNQSLVKAIENKTAKQPYINLGVEISKDLTLYAEHRKVIEQQYKEPLDSIERSSIAMDVDSQSLPIRVRSTPLPAPPVAPPSADAFSFAGKTLDSLAARIPHSSAAGNLSSTSLPPGAPSAPSGGFIFAGKPSLTTSVQSSTSAAGALEPTSSRGSPPISAIVSSSQSLDEKNTSATPSTPFPNTVSPSSPAEESPSQPLKLSPYAAFAARSYQPRNPSPLGLSPPVSAEMEKGANGTTSPVGTPPSTKLPPKFSVAATAGQGPPPTSSPVGVSSSNRQGPSSPFFGMFAPSSKPTGPISFGGFGSGAGSSTGFSFGTSNSGMNAAFSFGTSVPVSDASFAQDKGELLADAAVDTPKPPEAQSSLLSLPHGEPGTLARSSSFGLSHPGSPELEGEGEEEEVTVHQTRCKLYKATTKAGGASIEWMDLGVGWIRLKKHKDTGKRRMLFRQEGLGHVRLNFFLFPSMTATISQAKTVSFTGVEGSEPTSFKLRCKSNADAESLKTAILSEVEAVIARPPGVRVNEEAEIDASTKESRSEANDTMVLDKPEVEEVSDGAAGERAPSSVNEEYDEGEDEGTDTGYEDESFRGPRSAGYGDTADYQEDEESDDEADELDEVQEGPDVIELLSGDEEDE